MVKPSDMNTYDRFLACNHDSGTAEPGPCIHCGALYGICSSCGLYDWLWDESDMCAECEQD